MYVRKKSRDMILLTAITEEETVLVIAINTSTLRAIVSAVWAKGSGGLALGCETATVSYPASWRYGARWSKQEALVQAPGIKTMVGLAGMATS